MAYTPKHIREYGRTFGERTAASARGRHEDQILQIAEMMTAAPLASPVVPLEEAVPTVPPKATSGAGKPRRIREQPVPK
jgi:hypothetical protein